jgi:hypothetical protein
VRPRRKVERVEKTTQSVCLSRKGGQPPSSRLLSCLFASSLGFSQSRLDFLPAFRAVKLLFPLPLLENKEEKKTERGKKNRRTQSKSKDYILFDSLHSSVTRGIIYIEM